MPAIIFRLRASVLLRRVCRFMTAAFFLLCAARLPAQSEGRESERQLQYADSLFAAERFFDAATEYERYLYFASGDSARAYTLERAGEAYRYCGDFTAAKAFFARAYRQTPDSRGKRRIHIQMLRAQLLQRDLSSARASLDALRADTARMREAENDYWEGWYYIFADDWAAASAAFAASDSASPLAAFCAQTAARRYSPQLARGLSAFLPGAGALYTREYLNAAISLAWNVLFGYFTVSAFLDNRIFDGLMNGEFLWFRFYSGGIENAEEYAKKKNAEITRSALHYLEYDFQGIKP